MLLLMSPIFLSIIRPEGICLSILMTNPYQNLYLPVSLYFVGVSQWDSIIDFSRLPVRTPAASLNNVPAKPDLISEVIFAVLSSSKKGKAVKDNSLLRNENKAVWFASIGYPC